MQTSMEQTQRKVSKIGRTYQKNIDSNLNTIWMLGCHFSGLKKGEPENNTNVR